MKFEPTKINITRLSEMSRDITYAKLQSTIGTIVHFSNIYPDGMEWPSITLIEVEQGRLFKRIFCVQGNWVNSWNKSCLLKSKRIDARTRWDRSVLTLTCATNALILKFNEIELVRGTNSNVLDCPTKGPWFLLKQLVWLLL